MKFCILLAALCSVVQADYSTSEMNQWKSYKTNHGKRYANATEEKFRMKVFMDHLHNVTAHNKKFDAKKVSFKLTLNKFADTPLDEFVKKRNGFKPPKRSKSSQAIYNIQTTASTNTIVGATNLPASMDWRKYGAVTPVKDQGQCGSCWTYSSTGALEAQHFFVTGNLVELSKQNLIDCSTSYGNSGCNGGAMNYAFKYIKSNPGINTEASYPYQGLDLSCRFISKSIAANVTSYVNIATGDEAALMNAVANIGPVSVAIDASHDSFQMYSSGVYYEPACSSSVLDHAVLVIGYGTDSTTGLDYWLVKNSWNTTWGESGYVRMARNRNNNCGIASAASYPLD